MHAEGVVPESLTRSHHNNEPVVHLWIVNRDLGFIPRPAAFSLYNLGRCTRKRLAALAVANSNLFDRAERFVNANANLENI